jgi:hypothetical protein
VCQESQEWFDGMKTHYVKIESGHHFRWYFTISHAVLVTNLVLLVTVEECSTKTTGKEERTTVGEAHFGVQPRLDQYLLLPFEVSKVYSEMCVWRHRDRVID